MKKILLLLSIVLLIAADGFSQAPGIFNYQGVARNSVGNVLVNKSISLRLTVRDNSAAGPMVYQETRSVITNPFGLFNVQVGSPGASGVTGTIAGVSWGVGLKFIQVEIDPNGGNAFINIGTAQLASVPYSLFATATGDLVLPFNKTQSDAGALLRVNNSGTGNGLHGSATSGVGVYGTSSIGNAGLFEVTNTASTADAVRATTAGTGASWAIRGISSGTNGAGLFQQTNATNTANNLQSNQAGLGRAGLFNATNVASTANAVDINVAGTGFGLRIASTNATPRALQTSGGVQLTGLGEANNFVLTSDAAGNGTWVDPAILLPGANLWSRVGTNLWNTNLGDNVGIGTITPTHRLTVEHGGATGIASRSSASFSVVDIDAFSGDAALRFYDNGVGRWNTRNRPLDDNYEIFQLGGGGSRFTISSATGYVGLGGPAAVASPAYSLDVEHTGGTGIRSRSTGSFSVVDIDASSGDAAIRFQRAGVGQWNARNRPLSASGSNNDFEIFELGGGGSRFVINDGTGYVGIGGAGGAGTPTDIPTYQLDVLNGGGTGIRSKSSSTFSVVDIDAASGDAALRFQRAGVGQWNTRNRPLSASGSTNDYEIFELGGGGSRIVISDGTGYVGIGGAGGAGTPTDIPTYQLDVLNGGGTGIRSKSSSTFSVVDIDAASGDAALRFQRAGVGRWNTRNRPLDDNYEIFQLGGGGSRFTISSSTGYVGLGGPGAVASPAYSLDVEHTGGTGIRSKSSSTFSVVDIDAASGDAALRFQKAGTGMWNTRNNPGAGDSYQIFELGGGGERMRIDRGTGTVVVNGNFTALGVKAFTMDHPLDPENKTLMHAAIESNEVLNAYSGNVVTNASGKATVSLPDYFEAINKDFRYQLTVVGTFAQAIISKEVSNNKFEIATSVPNVKVSWEVKGIRNDKHMQKFPFKSEEEKSAAIKGKYIDVAAYELPASKGVSYDASLQSSLKDVKISQAKTVQPVSVVGTSLEQKAIPNVNTGIKAIENSGSVAPKVETNKAEAKPVEVKGTSIEGLPAKVEVEKKATVDPGSTKTD